MQRMIGDATSKAVGAASCSVLVVPEGAAMWRKRIILATDGSRFSDAAAVAAARVAARVLPSPVSISAKRPCSITQPPISWES